MKAKITTNSIITDETRYRLVNSYKYRLQVFDRNEFIKDVNRIVRITRLCSKIYLNKQVDLQLLLNELKIIENVFGDTGYFTLFEYLEDHPELIPIVYTLLYYTKRIQTTPTLDEKLYNQLIALETK